MHQDELCRILSDIAATLLPLVNEPSDQVWKFPHVDVNNRGVA